MKRIFAILAAFSLLLTACSEKAAAPRGTTFATVKGVADTALPRRIVFAVDSEADKIIIDAAASFCNKANLLSKGGFTLVAEKSGDPIADLKSGKAGLVLLDTEKAAALHQFFSITGESFRYSGYEDFSVICNSSKVLQRLSDASKTRVFAAFYTGSDMLVSSAPVGDMFALDEDFPDEESSPKPLLSTVPGTGAAQAFEFLGAAVAEEASLSGRVRALAENGAIIEISAAEIEDAKLAEAVLSAGDYVYESLYLTRSFHSIDPLWLVLAPSFYESLSPEGKAAIDEAAACMAGSIDGFYRGREQGAAAFADTEGILVSDDFKAIRLEIKRAADENRGDISDEEKRFRELLARLE